MVTPLGDRLLVRRTTGESRTSFGLVLPFGEDRALSHEGVVERVGVGMRWDGKCARFDASVGDRVVYSTRIDAREVDGVMFDLVENDSIIGIRDGTSS